MRDCYKRATGSNSAVLTLIMDSSSSCESCTELPVAWNKAVQLHSDVVFTTMNVTASEQNRCRLITQ